MSIKLENGLEIFAEKMPGIRSMALGFFVRCGSRNETSRLAGVSHFLEHMTFKGTETRTAQDVNRELDALGISFNACTSEETTIYYASLLPEFLEKCVAVFADILNPSLREEDFESEKNVILEEIGMYEDAPPFCMDEKIRRAFFGNHPLGNPVLGSLESVSALTSEQMRGYFQKWYAPGNIVVCACGNIEEEHLAESLSEASFSGRNAKKSPARKTWNLPKWAGEVRTFSIPTATQQYLLQCSHAPAGSSDERYAARLLASLMGDDSGSRLYWELVDSGLAEHAEMGYMEYSDAGMFNVSIGCEPEDWRANLKKVERMFQQVEAGAITEKELSLSQNRIVTDLVLGSERPEGRMFGVGGEWLARHCRMTVWEEAEQIRKVTLSDLSDLLKKYPPTQSLTYSIGK